MHQPLSGGSELPVTGGVQTRREALHLACCCELPAQAGNLTRPISKVLSQPQPPCISSCLLFESCIAYFGPRGNLGVGVPVTAPMLQTRKLKSRESEPPAQGHTASKHRHEDSNSCDCALSRCSAGRPVPPAGLVLQPSCCRLSDGEKQSRGHGGDQRRTWGQGPGARVFLTVYPELETTLLASVEPVPPPSPRYTGNRPQDLKHPTWHHPQHLLHACHMPRPC